MNAPEMLASAANPWPAWPRRTSPSTSAARLVDYDMYRQDRALVEAVHREGAAWADDRWAASACSPARPTTWSWALANKHLPELDTHDRFGRRIDLVRFHLPTTS